MSNPTFKLEEQLSDLRSSQIAYKLTIENPDPRPIRLLSVEPRVPVGAKLLEVTDTSLEEASARKAVLIRELNLILSKYLWVASKSFRDLWVERQRESFKEVLSFSKILSAVF